MEHYGKSSLCPLKILHWWQRWDWPSLPEIGAKRPVQDWRGLEIGGNICTD